MLRKTTLKLSAKLLGTSAIAVLMSLVLIFSIGILLTHFLGAAAGEVIVQALCIIMYMLLIYQVAWQEGNRDPNRVNYNRMEKCLAKGLIAGIIADIPYILLFVYVMASWILKSGYTVSVLIYEFVNAPCLFIVMAMKNLPPLLFIFVLPLPALAGISYLLGYKRYSITDRIVFKKK